MRKSFSRAKTREEGRPAGKAQQSLPGVKNACRAGQRSEETPNKRTTGSGESLVKHTAQAPGERKQLHSAHDCGRVREQVQAFKEKLDIQIFRWHVF